MDKLLGVIVVLSIANIVSTAFLMIKILWVLDDIEAEIRIVKTKTNAVAIQNENTFKHLQSTGDYLTKLTDVYSELLDCVSNKIDEKDKENS